MGESVEIIDSVVPEKPEDFVSKLRLYLHNPSLELQNPLQTPPEKLENPSQNLFQELENPPAKLQNPLQNPPLELQNPPEKLQNPPVNPYSTRTTERNFVIWSDYIRLTGIDQKRSNKSLYNDLHSGKLGLNIKPVTMGNKKRYYCVEVTDPELIEKARLLGMRDMSSMVLSEGNSSSDEKLEFCERITQSDTKIRDQKSRDDTKIWDQKSRDDTKIWDQKSRDNTKIRDSLSGVIKEVEGELGGIELTLSDYIKYFGGRRTRRSVYRRVHQPGKFPFLVYPKLVGRRVRYFVRIADALMIKVIKMLKSNDEETAMKEKSSNEEDIISVKVKVPEGFEKVMNLIPSPEYFDYRLFQKFIKEEVMTGKLNNVSIPLRVEAQKYKNKNILMLRGDYERLKKIARSNRLKVSKLFTVLLKNYLIRYYQNAFSEGGKYGDMLSAC